MTFEWEVDEKCHWPRSEVAWAVTFLHDEIRREVAARVTMLHEPPRFSVLVFDGSLQDRRLLQAMPDVTTFEEAQAVAMAMYRVACL